MNEWMNKYSLPSLSNVFNTFLFSLQAWGLISAPPPDHWIWCECKLNSQMGILRYSCQQEGDMYAYKDTTRKHFSAVTASRKGDNRVSRNAKASECQAGWWSHSQSQGFTREAGVCAGCATGPAQKWERWRQRKQVVKKKVRGDSQDKVVSIRNQSIDCKIYMVQRHQRHILSVQ